MVDTKLVRVDAVAIGVSSGTYTVIENIIRFSCKQVSPEGVLVEPIPVINNVQPATAESRNKHWEIELELDSDNKVAFRDSAIISDVNRNAAIGYFLVAGVDTAGNNVSYSFESLKTWCSFHRGHVSSAPNVARHPSLYRFICTGTRTVGSNSISGTDTTGERYVRVNSVTVNGNPAYNVLTYDWELVGATGTNILNARHSPGSYQALGVVEPSGKHWAFRLVFDSSSDIFNAWIKESESNPFIHSTVAVSLQKTDGVARIHTYQIDKCYVSGNAPSSITEKNIYNPGALEFICIGTRLDTP